MSLVVLLLTFLVTLCLCNVIDGVPGLLIGLLQVPQWLFMGALLALFAWCMEGEKTL